ncbi:acyl-CoA dehydrogenase [Fluoribacter dumoffii]|uniref:Acyl-CoA dehydrogenase, short-chain specific n=1 Tax=Fluoribacter dumoffii TaxID=463 RepID=A0A377GC87_9GAMM|nr:acyl-CoA dehydrogenase [Fluoribacter dumoffii]KTC90740.1 acyl-CoA dehydrogenase [Fluoribacter dumoffii NY 23]MCW8386421.1 acyl-CoA dehydrogenase [Fluoribacter dumoffii]MCW8452651.1 acyl-CoA dehydrogenase [Fluoribacter dumoffii]MCW8460099.1 acyl-CoA dehydrogenase [Fluoribacter dumoffii]MCW8483577.1 acyl-CoA dehydrogenase [Fluoribacter dumoffii]
MSSYSDLLQLIHSFEAYLGNPETKASPVNFKESLHFDEQEVLAWKQIKCIQQWGFMEYLIPQSLGGQLVSLDVGYFLVKSICRRDLTTGIALGLPFLGALPVWIAGNEQQKGELIASFRRGEITACALTEEEHGSDIMANEVAALPLGNGWELTGRKWCINFATEGQNITLLCRTHEGGGPLGFSVFFLNKSAIQSGFLPTPKLPTLGVRGLDISGFSLEKVYLSQDALIGPKQRGLEIIYKTLQVSRTLCAAFSVGAADTALRLVLSFSLQRQLYGKAAFEIPVVKQRLAEQFTQLLIADCTALAVARACSIIPEKLSFWSAIIKFLIPKIAERIVDECAIVMGARAYLRTTEWSMFQKIRRDISVIGLFDGSSQVNLSVIAGNLLPQAKMRGNSHPGSLQQMDSIFNLNCICPEFSFHRLGLFIHTEDDIVAGLSVLKSKEINPLIDAVRFELNRLDQEILSLHEKKLWDPRSLQAFRLAEQYCWIFAAGCCLHFWHCNQDLMSKEFLGNDWIHLAIQLILNQLDSSSAIESRWQESMAGCLSQFYKNKRLFSVLPIKIPD